MAVETIFEYLDSIGYTTVPRDEKHVVPFVLESEKLNKAQQGRMDLDGIIMEKLDGVYALVTIYQLPDDTYEVRHWNRTGKAMANCEALDERIAYELQDNKEYVQLKEPRIVISEVTSDDPLAKLSGYLNPNRVNEAEWAPTNMKDNFHDTVTFNEFSKGFSDVPFFVRQDWVDMVMGELLELSVIPMHYGTLRAAKAYAEVIWEQGGEGVVYAQANGVWEAGRRDETKIKIKEKLSFDVTVVGMVSGKEGSKYENTLGKLVVAFRAFGDTEEGELLWVPISGMTDAERDLWWNNPTLIVGSTVKMDAKSFTENGNLREPRYKEVRADKSSDFPVKVLEEVVEFTKGKALHRIHEIEAEL